MSDSRKESQGYMHLIHTVTGEYKPWTIYIVMEYSISFSMQKGKEFALKKSRYHIFEKSIMGHRL